MTTDREIAASIRADLHVSLLVPRAGQKQVHACISLERNDMRPEVNCNHT